MSTKPTSAGAVCAKLEEKLRKLRAQHEFTVRNYSDQIATLKTELENERHATRNLTRSHKADVKAVREEEQKKCQNLVEQIRAQLNLKFKEELEKEKKRLTEKYQLKKKPSTSTASRISRIFKVGDTTASKSKTSHVKELVRRLNGLQTGPSGTAPGKSFKCVTKTPSNSSHQMPRDLSSLSGVSGVQSSSSKQESSGVDTDSVTEEPIVPQIIVPNQDCELENRLPDDSLTEDGVMEDRNSVINSWTKGVGVETLYTLLSSAHLELQRAHLILQSNLRKEQRTRKHLEEKVRYLNSIILSQKSKTNILINPINSSLSQQLEACKEREGKLLEQLQELNDQNELLEFRVLELEQCTGVGSEHTLAKRAVSRTPDTDISDSGVISLSPSEDIYCSDSDLHDIHVKLEPTSSSMGGDVKERLSLLCQNLDNVSERIIIQQAINLLRHYEARISGMEATVSNMCQEVAMCRSMSSPEDSPPSTGSPSSTVDSCRKPSPRIIATVLPFSGLPNPRQEDTRPFCSLPNPSRPDEFCSLPNASRPDEEEEEDLMTIESPFRKLFRENDSMQESGIYFEDEDLGFHCQGTQTDSANQSRLSEELRKLSQIRQKLEQEQEREKYFKPIKEDKSKIMCSRQELEYYKEEMERLELRLQLYESCGEEHNARLKTMLERDEILKKQLHRLEEDNMKLRRDNQFLEMEKCEYEELENDTRLQCQRLEVKLNSMNEKKLELQTQLSHNARLINNLKSNLEDNDKSKAEAAERLQAAQDRIQSLETTISCYETSLNKCEQKNFELEEKEMELKYRVYLLENILPVLISYHLYWIVERSRAFSRQCTSSKYEMISCDNSSNSVLPLSSNSNRIDNTRALALLDVESPEQSRIDHTENKHSELNATSHSIPNKCHIETQTMFDDMTILRNECQCQLRVHTDSSEGDRESPLPNDECISQTSEKSQPNEPNINSSEQLQCENCANNNTTATLNMEKIEELNRMISDLKIKEKLYEQTMSEADEMFSNMTLEYGVQIENLENQINTTTLDLRAMKKELEKEREENDRMSNGNVELMKEIKAKENEKKQLNNMLECLKMQLEEEREESLKFKQEISSFKKLFETEKSKCKELEMDLKEANREIKEIESRVESSVKSHDKEMDRMSKKLEDMVVTNGELKEEVDTLENVVKELKLALNHERYRRESLKSELSRELQLKTQELSDLRRHMQGVGLKTTAQEMEEALASLEHKDEDDGCHLSITEIPDQLEKLTEKLSESQDHTQTCELCKNNLSVIVQELMDQIATIKTSKICQGPHSDDVYKMATLPRIKPTSSHTSTGNSKHPPNPSHPNLDSNSVTQSTLQSKCQEKDLLIFNLAFELKQLADRNLWVRYPALVDNLRKHISDCPDFNRVLLVQYLNGKLVMTPKFSEKSLLDLRIIKAVGSNSLLIAWKPPPPEYAVLEFLVYINGEYLRKIYAEQGRALLHPVQILQLDKPIQVTLMSADAKYPSASAYYC